MTTSEIRLALHSPEALIASLPFLLGFHPSESAVIVWLGERRILLTQRLDLPPEDPCDAWHDAVWGHAGVLRASSMVVVVVSAAPVSEALVDRLTQRAAQEGIDVRDVLWTDAGRWRSALCGDPGCCPVEGRAIDPGVLTAVAAEFAYAGVAPVANRDELVRSMAADADAIRETAPRVRSVPEEGREAWRDRCLRRLQDVATHPGRAATPSGMARVISALADVRVRDTLLWEASRWDAERLDATVHALTPALRAAPEGHVAPLATVVAGLAWLGGDGARATTALERARTDDPEYSLARLLGSALGAGLPPEAWRMAMAGLTREECRYGTRGTRRPMT